MRCLQCDAKLTWLARLKNTKFCSEEHRETYLEAQDKTAFAELNSRKSSGKANADAEDPDLTDCEALHPEEDTNLEQPEQSPETPDLVPAEVEEGAIAIEAEELQMSTDLTAIEYAAAGLEMEAGTDGTEGDTLAERYARFLSMLDAERHYYQDLLDRLPAGVAVIGGDLRVIYSNRAFRQLQGQDSEEPGHIGVTSPEVRDAIGSIMSAYSNGNDAAPILLGDTSHLIRVEPVTLLSKEDAGADGVLVFAAAGREKAMAAEK